MNARTVRWAIGAVLILAAACGGPEGEATGARGGASAMTAVDLAVMTAQAVQANPAVADSILVAHGLTRAGFDSLLYSLAADSALAREYSEAIR